MKKGGLEAVRRTWVFTLLLITGSFFLTPATFADSEFGAVKPVKFNAKAVAGRVLQQPRLSADIARPVRNVRYYPESGHEITDVCFSSNYVRYRGYSGHKIQSG